jgi:hypothetical protein
MFMFEMLILRHKMKSRRVKNRHYAGLERQRTLQWRLVALSRNSYLGRGGVVVAMSVATIPTDMYQLTCPTDMYQLTIVSDVQLTVHRDIFL